LTEILNKWNYHESSIFGVYPIPSLGTIKIILTVLKDLKQNLPSNFRSLLNDLKLAYANVSQDLNIDNNGSCRQGDASEFLTYVLDQTQILTSRTIALPYVFLTTTINERTLCADQVVPSEPCIHCLPSLDSPKQLEHMLDLLLPPFSPQNASDVYSLQTILNDYFVSHDGNSIYECPTCKIKQHITPTRKISSTPPPVLIAVLQRKTYSTNIDTG
jgi:uncharacterized UBP type Zn finger protein